MSVPRRAGLPAGVIPKTFTVSNGSLAAISASPARPRTGGDIGGTGTVLCSPGYTGSKEDFTPLLPLLADAGLRAIAIDLRGQFESRGPQDDSAYRRDALAADIGDLIAGLGNPHVVAHSYGGIVARAAVLAGARPASLTLLGSGPAGIQGNRRLLIELMEPILTSGGIEAVWAAAEALNANDPRRAGVPDDVQDFLAKRFLSSSPIGLRVMGEDIRSEPDRVAELARTGIPLLVAHGVDDDAWPPAVQAEMASRLGASYAVIPDSLHSPAVEAPEALAEVLLDFWGSRHD